MTDHQWLNHSEQEQGKDQNKGGTKIGSQNEEVEEIQLNL